MTTTKDRLEFVHAMARHTRATVRQCEALMRYAATLQRLAEAACNGYHSIEEQSRDRDKQSRIQARVTELCRDITTMPLGKDESLLCSAHGAMHCSLCTKYGLVTEPKRCEALFQNDPRGAVLKIRVPDGYTNDMGREGICVPS